MYINKKWYIKNVAVEYLYYTGWHAHRPQYRRILEVMMDPASSCRCSFLHNGTLGHPRTFRAVAETSRQHTANYTILVLDKCL